MPSDTWAIVVAGGEGRRFGAAKQFLDLAGRPVLDWSVEAARSVADEVVLVLPSDALGDPARHAGCRLVAAGGVTRADSVRAGLALVAPEVEYVLVHDAARPLASPALFRAVADALAAGAEAVVPGLALHDTIKRVVDGRVESTLRREELVAVQTPQGFRAEVLRRAHATGAEASDDAALVEALGVSVRVVPGEEHNVKLTTTADLGLAALYLAEGAARPR